MKKALFVAVLASLLAAPALAETRVTVNPEKKAGPRCYSAAEAEADQGIRIHSELMVIGLNCNHMGKRYGQPLYAMYREFTAKHGALFAKYEEILIKYFERTGAANPTANLNTLRTNFANKISNDAAAARPDIFCSKYAPRILKAKDMTTEDVRKWATMTYSSHPSTQPLCAEAKK